MEGWKKIFIQAAGLGAGAVAALAVSAGGFLWWVNRPHPPKLWDTRSITAEYEDIRTTGPTNELLFQYALINSTDSDYRITDEKQVSIALKPSRNRAMIEATEVFKPKVPFFLPARRKMRFEIHMPYATPIAEPSVHASKEEWDKYRADLRAYMNQTFDMVDGFVMFDEANRYEVEFPPGWKSK